MSRYKEKWSTKSQLPLGGETIHKMEIEDTVIGETGKCLGWDLDKADSKALKNLKGKALPGFQVGEFELNKQLKAQNRWIV